jgi:hypothetical protein
MKAITDIYLQIDVDGAGIQTGQTAVFYVENSMGITVLKNLLTWTG